MLERVRNQFGHINRQTRNLFAMALVLCATIAAIIVSYANYPKRQTI